MFVSAIHQHGSVIGMMRALLKKRSEAGEGANQIDTQGKNVPDKGHHKCKGLRVGTCCRCGNGEKASMREEILVRIQ